MKTRNVYPMLVYIMLASVADRGLALDEHWGNVPDFMYVFNLLDYTLPNIQSHIVNLINMKKLVHEKITQ